MNTLARPRRARAVLGTMALLVALALPVGANADTTGGGGGSGGLYPTIGQVRLLAKVVAVVHVTFTCDPLNAYDWNTGQVVVTTDGVLEYAAASVWQASGRSVAQGSTSSYGGSAVICDSTTVNAIDISVPTSTVPFKVGSAVVSVDLLVTDANMTSGHSGSAGPVVVKFVTR